MDSKDQGAGSASESEDVDVGSPNGKDGPLEEYKALRAEILTRIVIQQNIVTLQLTVSGAVISFALAGSGGGRNYFLLILPFTSYMLSGRFARQTTLIANLGMYIQQSLSHRIPGGIQWEDWRLRQFNTTRFMDYIDPLQVAFSGAASLALAIAAPSIITGLIQDVWLHVGVLALWVVGLLFTIATVRVTNTFVSRARQNRKNRMI